MALPLRRSGADDLSAAFARAIRVERRSETPIVGVEHEFRVLDGPRAIDFRRLIHDLPIPGRRLDPADPNAYRGAWGGSITSDGREAELAIPPQAIEHGFAARAAATASRGRREIRRALPADLRLEGYSTHISVSMPDRLVETAAREFASRFGPALLLLMDGPASPGLLVRPRPGRLELGAEFVDGERLQASLIFAAGAALAVARAVGSRVPWAGQRLAGRHLPPAVDVDLEPAIDRYGWFVGGAVGADLHGLGRRARLRVAERTRGARTISAQEHLERAWAAARRALHDVVGKDELALVDRFVHGDARLGVELDQAAAIALTADHATSRVADLAASGGTLDADDDGGPFGSVVRVRRRPGLLIEPAMVGWDFAVLRVTEDLATVTGRTAFACLPRAVLGPGLDALDRGHLDAILRAYLNLNADPRVLAGAPQTRRPGLFRTAAAGGKLLARELGPDVPGSDRPGKRDRPRDSQEPPGDPPPSTPPTPPSLPAGAAPAAAAAAAAFTIFGLPAAAAAAVVGVAAVAVVGGAILLGGTPAPTGPAGSGSPGASESPAVPGETTPGPLAFDCATYLEPSEITDVTGLEAGPGQEGEALVRGEEVCLYPVGGGSLLLSIWRDPEPRSFYDGSVGALEGPTEALGVGNEAVYTASGPRFPPFEGDDALAVLADGVTFTLWMQVGPSLGQAAHTALALLLLDRVGTEPLPQPSSAPGGAVVFGSGSATVNVFLDSGQTGTITEDLRVGGIDEDGNLDVAWDDGVFDPQTGTTGVGKWLDIVGRFEPSGIFTYVDGQDVSFGVWWDEANGEQVNSTAAGDFTCIVDMLRTVTGGIEGGISCRGVDQEYGGFTADGTFWAEPGGGGVEPSPGSEPTAYGIGGASLTFGGDISGGAELQFDSEGGVGDGEGGPTYPTLVFYSEDFQNFLELVMPVRRPSGTFNTLANEVGIYWGIEGIDSGRGPENYANGHGLVHGIEPTYPEVYCLITFNPTPTEGVTGTIECPNVNHPTLVYTLDGTFFAEPGGVIGGG